MRKGKFQGSWQIHQNMKMLQTLTPLLGRTVAKRTYIAYKTLETIIRFFSPCDG